MTKFDGGLTCSIGVSDLDASIGWYQDIFGAELLYRMEEMAWCELASPVARVNFGLSQVDEVKQGGGATLTFGVEDIDAAARMIADKGVKTDGPIHDIPDMVRLLTFYDPDGNALMFYQDLQK